MHSKGYRVFLSQPHASTTITMNSARNSWENAANWALCSAPLAVAEHSITISDRYHCMHANTSVQCHTMILPAVIADHVTATKPPLRDPRPRTQ